MESSHFLQAIWLILPIVIAGVLHMLAVRWNIFPVLKIPVNARLFGANKTLRGFVLMPVFCSMGVFISHSIQISLGYSSVFFTGWLANLGLGLLLGLGYCLGELPNSWYKRRLGIPPGQSLPGRRVVSLITDHMDSLIGCLFVYGSFLVLTVMSCVFIIILGPVIHVLINLGLYAVGVRKEPL
jgi:CDP-diacylglycerol--serine O-phosphatidyltransferase